MEIKLIRTTSKGIAGTHANANHHAQELLPFIKLLEAATPKLGFALWKQGHNIHEFVTAEGRTYTLRPIGNSDGDKWAYTGIRLSLRVSRSEEHPLFDATNVQDTKRMIEMLKMLAQSSQGISMKENRSLQLKAA